MREQNELPVARFTLVGAAVLTGLAAAIHLLRVPAEADEYWLFGVFFAGAGLLQLVGAMALLRRYPPRTVLYAILVLNLGIAAIWVYTRFIAIPVGPEAGEKDVIGFQDSLCTAVEVGASMLVGYALHYRTRRVASTPEYQLA